MLRGATFAGRIEGWYGGTESLPNEFFWHPNETSGMRSLEEAEAFAVELFREGIDPLYTSVEPWLEEAV